MITHTIMNKINIEISLIDNPFINFITLSITLTTTLVYISPK